MDVDGVHRPTYNGGSKSGGNPIYKKHPLQLPNPVNPRRNCNFLGGAKYFGEGINAIDVPNSHWLVDS